MTIDIPARDTRAREFAEAASILSAFILDAADRTASAIGFGYVLVPGAPDNYPALITAYRKSLTTGAPLPISAENSDDVIYKPANVNGALRFWHDVNHFRHQLDFGLVDELEPSLWHLGELEQAGHPPDSLVWRLLHADLTGHAYVQAFAQGFPVDQCRFVTGCVTAGFDHGLLAELRTGEAT